MNTLLVGHWSPDTASLGESHRVPTVSPHRWRLWWQDAQHVDWISDSLTVLAVSTVGLLWRATGNKLIQSSATVWCTLRHRPAAMFVSEKVGLSSPGEDCAWQRTTYARKSPKIRWLPSVTLPVTWKLQFIAIFVSSLTCRPTSVVNCVTATNLILCIFLFLKTANWQSNCKLIVYLVLQYLRFARLWDFDSNIENLTCTRTRK